MPDNMEKFKPGFTKIRTVLAGLCIISLGLAVLDFCGFQFPAPIMKLISSPFIWFSFSIFFPSLIYFMTDYQITKMYCAMNTKITAMNIDIDCIKKTIPELDGKIEEDIKKLNGKIEEDIKKLDGKIEEDIKKLDGKIEEDIKKLDGKIEEDIKKLDGKIEEDIKKLDNKIEKLIPKPPG